MKKFWWVKGKKFQKIETDESARGKIFINWPDHNFKKEVDFGKGQTEQKQFLYEIIQIGGGNPKLEILNRKYASLTLTGKFSGYELDRITGKLIQQNWISTRPYYRLSLET